MFVKAAEARGKIRTMSAQNKVVRVDEWLLGKIHESVGQPPIRLSLESGAGVSPTGASPIANLVIKDRRTLLRLLLDPEMGFGEAYREGHITVEGDLIATLEAVYQSISKKGDQNWYAKLVSQFIEYVQRNSLAGSRENVHRHYDLSNDFYRLWLDSQLVYTCAYFKSPSMSLEEAQIAKMDYVCRKLRLQPGERVVDAGCGWGALALHMAKNYGVNVRAFNVSHEQVLWARRRAKDLGLNSWVEFILDDYRNISGTCDAFVSVGMLEHVGLEHFGDLGSVIHHSLGKTGRGLLHFIGRNQPSPFSTWTRKRIFPGAYAPTLGQVREIFEPWNLSVLDVENLRPHYQRTLEEWLERFELSTEQVAKMFGPEFVRMWRLYLAGAVAAFRAGSLQLFQVLFARNACQQIPWTRTDLYQEGQQEVQETKWTHTMS
jgi:cyclopropane-fatty-acyl-phospholipid synthase